MANVGVVAGHLAGGPIENTVLADARGPVALGRAEARAKRLGTLKRSC